MDKLFLDNNLLKMSLTRFKRQNHMRGVGQMLRERLMTINMPIPSKRKAQAYRMDAAIAKSISKVLRDSMQPLIKADVVKKGTRPRVNWLMNIMDSKSVTSVRCFRKSEQAIDNLPVILFTNDKSFFNIKQTYKNI